MSAAGSLNACAINAPAIYIGNRPTVSESDTAISCSAWRFIDETVSDVLPMPLAFKAMALGIVRSSLTVDSIFTNSSVGVIYPISQ